MAVTTIFCRDDDSNYSMIEVEQKKVCLCDTTVPTSCCLIFSVQMSVSQIIIETEKIFDFHHMKFSKKIVFLTKTEDREIKIRNGILFILLIKYMNNLTCIILRSEHKNEMPTIMRYVSMRYVSYHTYDKPALHVNKDNKDGKASSRVTNESHSVRQYTPYISCFRIELTTPFVILRQM